MDNVLLDLRAHVPVVDHRILRMPAPLLMRCLRLSRQRTLAAGYAAYRPYSESY